MAVARGADDPASREDPLTLLGLLGLEDPQRPDVHAAVTACRHAGIRLVMITGDHPGTARAIAAEVGLLRPGGAVLVSPLEGDDDELAAVLDRDESAVVARVAPADKVRIAKILRARGHVVAMTGTGSTTHRPCAKPMSASPWGRRAPTWHVARQIWCCSTTTSGRSLPRCASAAPPLRTPVAS